MYTHDNNDCLPGPCWLGMFFTYHSTGNALDPYDGSLAGFIANYLTYPTPISMLQTSKVGMCPSSLRVVPPTAPNPPVFSSTNELAQVGNPNYTWNGGAGQWALGVAGWDAGVWNDSNNVIIGKGTDSAGALTINGAIKPANRRVNQLSHCSLCKIPSGKLH